MFWTFVMLHYGWKVGELGFEGYIMDEKLGKMLKKEM
jgi:hypothetical protein